MIEVEPFAHFLALTTVQLILCACGALLHGAFDGGAVSRATPSATSESMMRLARWLLLLR